MLTPSTPDVPNCYCSKGSAPYWSNPPFLIFDIRALWRSILSARAPECQQLKMTGYTSMAKRKALTGSAVKGLKAKDICWTALLTWAESRDRRHFTIPEVAVDWRELMTAQRIMQPSNARTNWQLDWRCSMQTHHHHNRPHQTLTR